MPPREPDASSHARACAPAEPSAQDPRQAMKVMTIWQYRDATPKPLYISTPAERLPSPEPLPPAAGRLSAVPARSAPRRTKPAPYRRAGKSPAPAIAPLSQQASTPIPPKRLLHVQTFRSPGFRHCSMVVCRPAIPGFGRGLPVSLCPCRSANAKIETQKLLTGFNQVEGTEMATASIGVSGPNAERLRGSSGLTPGRRTAPGN